MTDDTDQDLRAYAIGRLKRKRHFLNDVAGYLTVNAVLWAIWAATDRSTNGMPWPAWVSIIWGFFLLLDGLKLLRVWGWLNRPITEADIEREIKRTAAALRQAAETAWERPYWWAERTERRFMRLRLSLSLPMLMLALVFLVAVVGCGIGGGY